MALHRRPRAKVLLFTEIHAKPTFQHLLADQFRDESSGSLFDFHDSDRAVDWCEDQCAASTTAVRPT